MFKDFRKTKVWNLGRYLLLVVFQVTEEILDEANSNLIMNMRKSCLEILINIEKTFVNYQKDDDLKYLNRSLIAVRHLEKDLLKAQKMQLFQNSHTDELLKKTIEVKRLLNSLAMKIDSDRKIVINSFYSSMQRLLCLEELTTI